MLDSQAASKITSQDRYQPLPETDELYQRLQDYLRLSGVALSPSVELEVIAISEAAINRSTSPDTGPATVVEAPRRHQAYRDGLNRLIRRFGLDDHPPTTPPPAIHRCGMGYGPRT